MSIETIVEQFKRNFRSKGNSSNAIRSEAELRLILKSEAGSELNAYQPPVLADLRSRTRSEEEGGFLVKVQQLKAALKAGNIKQDGRQQMLEFHVAAAVLEHRALIQAKLDQSVQQIEALLQKHLGDLHADRMKHVMSSLKKAAEIYGENLEEIERMNVPEPIKRKLNESADKQWEETRRRIESEAFGDRDI